MQTYPNHSDYYGRVLKFNIWSLSKIDLFSFSFVCRGEGHLQWQILNKLCLYQVSFVMCKWTLMEVLKIFSIMWQNISWHDLHHMIASVSSQCQTCEYIQR